MSVINTNITSMIAQKNLGSSQSALTTSMERLSSGLRINSAKDDAAGQAIANRMTSQTRGLAQAQRNANDGISVAQTAEGALNQVNDNLQRIRELTVQAQNDTNNNDDRKSIQAEIDQRLTEINRISSETNFNGVKVLNGEQSLNIQVGANDGESIKINLKEINAKTLKLDKFNVAGAEIDTAKVDATAATKARVGADVTLTDPTFTGAPAGGAADASKFYEAKDGKFYVEVKGSTAPADDGFYEITVGDNGTITAALGGKGAVTASDLTEVKSVKTNVTLSGADAANTFAYTGTESNAPSHVIKEGAAGSEKYYAASIDATGAVTKGKELNVGEKTANPLEALDSALKQVDELRSDLGAIQNRFNSAITNLKTNETNLSAAKSRIEDADYAVEVANMTRAQILQQAGTSVLAQANQIPQGVLSLLR